MKKTHPLLLLNLLIGVYAIVIVIVAFIVDMMHSGGDQFFLRIIFLGIKFWPILTIILLVLITFANKEWALKRWYLALSILAIFITISIIFWI